MKTTEFANLIKQTNPDAISYTPEVILDLAINAMEVWPAVQVAFARLACPSCRDFGKPPKLEGFTYYHPGGNGNFSMCRATGVWSLKLEKD